MCVETVIMQLTGKTWVENLKAKRTLEKWVVDNESENAFQPFLSKYI